MGKTIGIVSLKGGVGKTSVVSALGAAMADFGKKVLLVDGNFSAPNLGIHLDIINPTKTIQHVLSDVINLKDAIHKVGNFDVIPASVSYRSKINHFKLKDKLKHAKKKYDTILIDSSPSLNDETLAAMLASDYILVVTTPDYPTLSMTLKAIKIAKQRGIPIAGLILNKVYNKNFELDFDDVEKTAEVPILGVIPHDVKIMKALAHAIPSTLYKPRSKASKEYKRLAAALIGERYEPLKLRKMMGWINPNKQDINREIFYDRVFK